MRNQRKTTVAYAQFDTNHQCTVEIWHAQGIFSDALLRTLLKTPPSAQIIRKLGTYTVTYLAPPVPQMKDTLNFHGSSKVIMLL